MRFKNLFAAGVAMTAIAAVPAFAQDAGNAVATTATTANATADGQTGGAPEAAGNQDDPNDIIITAR